MQHTTHEAEQSGFLTTSRVARALETSEGNVRRLARAGLLPCLRVGTLRLFRSSDVAQLAEVRAAAGRG